MAKVRPFVQASQVMRLRANQIPVSVGELMRGAAREIDRGVIEDTRVDTGVHRSNWVVTIDRPFGGVLPAFVPGSNLGKGESANRSAAIAAGRGAIAGFNPEVNKAIFITNNAPAISLLNSRDGNFVQKHLKRTAALVRKGRIFPELSTRFTKKLG